MRNYRHIEVKPIAGALGAEIVGVDMSRELDDEVVSEVRHAFLEHLVIFLRDQKVTPTEQIAFAKRFGQPIEYPQLKGLPDAPMITPVEVRSSPPVAASTWVTRPAWTSMSVQRRLNAMVTLGDRPALITSALLRAPRENELIAWPPLP